MNDIGKELYAAIRADFERRLDDIPEPAELSDISGYGARLGQALAQAIRGSVSQDKLPDERMYYNIAHSILDPALRENYRLVNKAAETVQLALDELMNVHLKVQHADFPEKRVNEIIGAASIEGIEWYRTMRRMTSPVENISQSFADDFIKANAEFRYGAGFDTYVERTGGSGCCAWCAKLSGKFDYPDNVSKDVFARHDNCTCAVSYKTGGMHHDPHTNLKLDLPEPPPLRLDDSMQAAAIANANRVLEKKHGKNLTNGANGGTIEEKSKEYNAIVEAFSTFSDSNEIVKTVMENHMGLAEFTPQGMKEMLENAGYTTKPLNQSATWKGVPFEEGGGYRINFGGDAYFQYHPEEGSHHNGAYWKIANGKNGKKRYKMDGTIKED